MRFTAAFIVIFFHARASAIVLNPEQKLMRQDGILALGCYRHTGVVHNSVAKTRLATSGRVRLFSDVKRIVDV